MEYLELRDNTKIPQLGFGTASIGNFDKTKNVIKTAIDVGFRRFDTASMYGNEAAIGDAIKESDVSRDELFITTKLWNGGDFSYDNTLKECNKSVDRLGLDYVDMYLHHWPVKGQRLESWRAMEKLQNDGKTKYIGVSNYTITHLEELLENSVIPPELNQVEFNPFLFQEDLMNYCRDHSIILEAYSPLAQGKRLNHATLIGLSQKYNKSTAQILLRWAIEHKISVIPKSSSEDHIRSNFSLFDFQLSRDEIKIINGLDEGLRLEWDPTNVM